MDIPKERRVTEYVDGGLIVHNNVQCGDGVIALIESFGAMDVGDTPAIPSWYGEGDFQITLG